MDQELFDNFALAIGAGVLMVFAVLVLLFARVFQPITILSALPLSLAGVAIALLVTRNPMSLPVIIGILYLAPYRSFLSAIVLCRRSCSGRWKPHRVPAQVASGPPLP